ncbi:MAG: hypothetical protein KDJ38_18670 [Gammaproteobacteria bacterium]|nr:hypothetical protein [Gammaproteobacteria bacterium]
MIRRLNIRLAALLILQGFIGLNAAQALARDNAMLELETGTEVDIRVFPAKGDSLLLGFACDEGHSLHEEETAATLAKGGVEVWMPDMLGAHMLPKVRSSIAEIPTEEIVEIINRAHEQTGKKIYLIATGPDAELILRGAQLWEKGSDLSVDDSPLQGAILMFPRLNAGEPEPGQEPVYVESVGKTRLPIMVLEGQRTPNSWGLAHFTEALGAGGSEVIGKVIPDVRGYFFKRDDANESEEVVTSQLSGLIKASLMYLNGTHHDH